MDTQKFLIQMTARMSEEAIVDLIEERIAIWKENKTKDNYLGMVATSRMLSYKIMLNEHGNDVSKLLKDTEKLSEAYAVYERMHSATN